jgi:hypothetical protein
MITMITHIFYHQETVEEICAQNSWASINNNFDVDDEVILLDLGDTLRKKYMFRRKPKYFRYVKIRTDSPQEKSYTYGLNNILPLSEGEWVCLWRSDYIYTHDFYLHIIEGMNSGNVVLPYEAFIGAEYCSPNWCKRNLKRIIEGDEKYLLRHAHVCPVYETWDFPHFAIKKNVWIELGGMDTRLWGYGHQFTEFFQRFQTSGLFKPSFQFDLIAFHQNHKGSFSLGLLDDKKRKELIRSEENYNCVIKEDQNRVKQIIQQEPIIERRPERAYKHKLRRSTMIWQKIRNHWYLFYKKTISGI